MLRFQKWKIGLIVAVLLVGALSAMPNLFSRQALDALPSWFPKTRVILGLDLQGGSHLLLEVGVKTVIQDELNSVVDAVRASLRKANIGYSDLGVQGNSVVLKLRDTAQIDEARKLLKDAALGLDLSIADDGTATLSMSDQMILDRERKAVEQSIEIVRRRIDETGTREPTIQRQGEDRILVQLPGVKDPEHIKELIGRTAKMTFRFVDTSISPEQAKAGNMPPTDELLPDAKTGPDGQPIAYYVVQKRVMVSGENLVDAQATFQDAQPVVSFRFDSLGAKRFGDATKDNIGKLFAIVLDGKVISAPVIRDAILTGSGIISGNFTTQSANDLAILLRAGALPAPLTVIEERTVGADLGADSIAAGKIASLIGLALIVVAMLLLYGLFGLFANIALLCNAILLMGALSLLEATLTLPGIAGIALTLGMAVDANVLIFERIREEVRAGRGPMSAIDAGYREAMNTIIDANLTTLISTLILFQFGSGPVRGFAVTLSIGIVTSVFTAVMVTRLVTVLWLRTRRQRSAPLPL
ncbi:MAG: protein translocase subunit SecD [Pseudomonadota bacterium]